MRRAHTQPPDMVHAGGVFPKAERPRMRASVIRAPNRGPMEDHHVWPYCGRPARIFGGAALKALEFWNGHSLRAAS